MLGVLWAVLPALLGFALLARANVVGEWLRGHQSNGPIIYAAGFMVLSGLGLLPTYASAILGGWAFGVEAGFPAALCGFTGGAVIGYLIAKTASGDRVEGMIREQPKWRAIRDALIGGSFIKTFAIITLVRLPPNSPFALTNLVLASVRARWVPFVMGTMLGMAPRTFAAVWLSAAVRELTAEEAQAVKTPKWVFVVGIAATVGVIMIVGMVAKAALARMTGGAGSDQVRGTNS